MSKYASSGRRNAADVRGITERGESIVAEVRRYELQSAKSFEFDLHQNDLHFQLLHTGIHYYHRGTIPQSQQELIPLSQTVSR